MYARLFILLLQQPREHKIYQSLCLVRHIERRVIPCLPGYLYLGGAAWLGWIGWRFQRANEVLQRHVQLANGDNSIADSTPLKLSLLRGAQPLVHKLGVSSDPKSGEE